MKMKASRTSLPESAAMHRWNNALLNALLVGVFALTGCSGDDGLGGGSTVDAEVTDSRPSTDSEPSQMDLDLPPGDAERTPDANMDMGIADAMATDPDQGPMMDMMAEPEDAAPPPEDAGCRCPGRQLCANGECVEPDICEGHIDCVGARLCEEGMCRDGCMDNNDCPAGRTCDLATQTCTEQGPCMSDDQCGDNLCVDGECTPRCRADDDCRGERRCDDSTGRCLESGICEQDADCSGMRVCEGGRCIDQCRDNADCDGAQRCAEGVCVEPEQCADDRDCLADRICVGQGAASRCQGPCTIEDCPRALACMRDTGRCEEDLPCWNDDSCFEGRICADEICIEPCFENADCLGAQSCEDGECVEPAVCRGAGDCHPGRVCVDGMCQDHCENTPCTGALLCERETGQCVEAMPCASNDGCFEGRVCEGDVCSDPCLEPADCPGGMRCIEGACEEPAICRGPFDCHMGRRCVDRECRDECVNGMCRGTRVCDDTGLCAEGASCAADRDCDGDRRCRVDAELCADPCANDAQCRGGFECGPDGLCREPRFCTPRNGCAGDAECLFGQCRVPECNTHGDCGDGFCMDFLCVDALPGECQCQEGWDCVDGHCVQPGRCFPRDLGLIGLQCREGSYCSDAGLCQACTEDAHCAGGRCEDGECTAPQACQNSGDCFRGYECRQGFCSIVRDGCDEDPLNNQDFGSAIRLPALGVSGLVACEGRSDWFVVDDPVGSRITVRYDAESTRIGIKVYTQRELGRTPSDVGTILEGETWANVGAGRYYVRVYALPGWAGDYSIVAEGGVECAEDQYDRPWRNDDVNNARMIGAGIFEGTLCPDDEDYFRYEGVGGAVQVSIEGNVEATVNGQPLPRMIVGGGLVHIQGQGNYTLTVQPDDSAGARCERAPEVALNSTFDASEDRAIDSFSAACAELDGNEAVFSFSVDAPGTISASIQQLDPGTTLMVYRDCDGEPLACSDAFGHVEAAVTPGTYYLVVEGGYRGDVAIDFAAQAAICDDVDSLDVNEDIAVEFGQRNADIELGCLEIAGGQAVYAFEVEEPSMVTLAMESDDGNAAASIRSVCNAEVSELQCIRAGAANRAQHMLAGTYYAVLHGDAATNVRLTIEPGGHFGPPTPEEACEDAPLVASGDVVVANVDDDGDDSFAPDCVGPGHPDRVFRVEVEAAGQIHARLGTPGPLSRVVLFGNSCDDEPVNCSEDGDHLSEAVEPGTYYVVIDGAMESDLEIVIEEDAEPIPADPVAACAAAPELMHGVPLEADVAGEIDNFSAECTGDGIVDRAFRVNIERPTTINARLEQALPGTRLLLFGDCGAPAIQCGGEFGDLQRRLPRGTYYIVIDGQNDGDLLLEMDPPPGGGPGEAGRACAEAPVIAPGVHQVTTEENSPNRFSGGCIFGASPDDVFRVDIAQRSTLRAALTEDAATASVLLYQDCDADPIVCSEDGPQIESVVDPGAYYVVVDGQYNGGLRLDVDEQGGPGGVLMEDFCGPAVAGQPVGAGTEYVFEDSTAGTADDLDASLCEAGFEGGGPDKLFVFDLIEGARVRATLDADFDATLILLDGDCFADPVCTAAAGQPSIDVELPAGTHILGVDGQGPGQSGDFTLNFIVE